MSAAPPYEPEPHVREVHERYVEDFVEGMGVCPFAKRARELGNVRRLYFDAEAGVSPAQAAAALEAEARKDGPRLEIALLTFVCPSGADFRSARCFEEFLSELREAYEARSQAEDGPPHYYMVAFHPDPPHSGVKLNPDAFVPLLRRTPDPVIQCVHAGVLDEVRKQAQQKAEEKLRREIAKLPPEIAALLKKYLRTYEGNSIDASNSWGQLFHVFWKI